MPSDEVPNDRSAGYILSPIGNQGQTMRSSRPAPSNNNNSTQLKAKVNLAESLVSPTNSPVPSVQSTPVSSTQSSTKLRSSSSSASLAPAGRIRSPLSNDSSSFPSKYASPTPPASNAPAGPNGQPRAFLKSGVSRSALSPETTFSSSASSHPPKRTVKASITSANLISGATAYTSSSVHARSPSPTKQAPASPPKRPTPRAAVSGLAKSHLSTPPTVTPRTKSAPSLKPSTSTSSLSRLTAHAPNSPRSPIPSPTTTSTRKLSTTSSSSSGQSAQHPSLPTSSLTSPSIDLPADPNSATRSKQGTTSNGNSHSAQQQPTTTEALHQGIEKLEQAQTGLGVTLNGVLDEEDLKEIERAKEREKEARENRKILDLEITNASLLAINAMLERAKQKQSSEISALRRKIREGPQFLPSPLPASPGASSSAAGGGDDDAEEGEEDDWNSILDRDPDFGRIARCLENLLDEGQRAVSAKPEDMKQPTTTKVISRFDPPTDLDIFEDSSFADDSMLSMADSPIQNRKSDYATRKGSRLRVSSISTPHQDLNGMPKPGPNDTSISTEDDSTSFESSHLSEASEPEAWSSGIRSPAKTNSSKSSTAASTHTQPTPATSIPTSPSRLAPPSVPSSSSSPNANGGAISTMANMFSWASPRSHLQEIH